MHYEVIGEIAHINTDDGKANVVNQAFADGFLDALEKAKAEAKAIVLSGRSGMFSAGFDLKVLQNWDDAAVTLTNSGMALLTALYGHPQPVVAACDGHAVGMGAFMLLASDFRLGSNGDYNVTLPETALGMPFTPVLMSLIHDRIPRASQTIAVMQSKQHGPDDAVTAGFLDKVVDAEALNAEAQALAEALAQMPAKTYAANKEDLRSATLKAMRASLTGAA